MALMPQARFLAGANSSILLRNIDKLVKSPGQRHSGLDPEFTFA
jgi:hypothetical protein